MHALTRGGNYLSRLIVPLSISPRIPQIHPLTCIFVRGAKKASKKKEDGGEKTETVSVKKRKVTGRGRETRTKLRTVARTAEREAMGQPVTEDDPLPTQDIYTMLTKRYNVPVGDNYEDGITSKELKELLDSNSTPYKLIDLREQQEIELLNDPPLPNALHVPVQPLTVKASEVDIENEDPNDFFRPTYSGLLHPLPTSVLRLLTLYHRIIDSMTTHKYAEAFKHPKFTRQEPLIFYSTTSNRSLLAVKSAKRLGYADVKFLFGGAKTWNKYYNPVTPAEAEPEHTEQTTEPEHTKATTEKEAAQPATNFM